MLKRGRMFPLQMRMEPATFTVHFLSASYALKATALLFLPLKRNLQPGSVGQDKTNVFDTNLPTFVKKPPG